MKRDDREFWQEILRGQFAPIFAALLTIILVVLVLLGGATGWH